MAEITLNQTQLRQVIKACAMGIRGLYEYQFADSPLVLEEEPLVQAQEIFITAFKETQDVNN